MRPVSPVHRPVFPTQVEELVLAEPSLAPYFQCVLTRPGRLDELTLLVETLAEMPQADRAAVAGRLTTQVTDRIGTTCTVEVRGPGGMERSIGKARRVVDQRRL